MVAPFASLYPGIGISNHPYKADRPLRDDEFKGADVANGSIATVRTRFAIVVNGSTIHVVGAWTQKTA